MHYAVLDMDGSATSFSPQQSDDFSTGYLEDALFEFSSKRRRLLPCTDDQQSKSSIFDDFEKVELNCFEYIFPFQQFEILLVLDMRRDLIFIYL